MPQASRNIQSMEADENLETYWVSFPRDPNLPFGIGVTAYSEDDAFALIKQQGFDEWYAEALEVHVKSGVTVEDLDDKNVVPNIGPMHFRGVWYPAANIGFGAPRDPLYKAFPVIMNASTDEAEWSDFISRIKVGIDEHQRY